jgi:hypothetical protein
VFVPLNACFVLCDSETHPGMHYACARHSRRVVRLDQKLRERLVAADGLIKFTEPGGYLSLVPAQLVSVNCSPSVGMAGIW